MARFALAAAACAAVAFAQLASAEEMCVAKKRDDNKCTWSCQGATYDMSVFTSDIGHRVLDSRHNQDSGNFTYVFNVCGDLQQAPNSHTPNPPGFFGDNCNVTHGNKDGSKLDGPAPAFQLSNKYGFCYRLGHSYKDSDWGLVDAANPSRGVSLTYKDGNTCDDGQQRSLKLIFMCGKDASNPFANSGHFVDEVDDCSYEIFTESIYGCPNQCPIVNNMVCNNKGVCDYDTDLKAARCFCQPGWGSNDCATSTDGDGGLDAVGGVLIFVCILLVALLGVLVYLWNKIRTLRLDPKAYAQLRGGAVLDDDEGTEDI